MAPSTPHRCSVCNFLTCNYNQWLIHISTWLHQEALFHTHGHGEAELELPHVRDKVVVASRIPKSTPLIDIARHFSTHGAIVNLIIGGKEENLEDVHGMMEPTKQIIVVFGERAAVRKTIQDQNAQWLWGKMIEIRALFDGPDLWGGRRQQSPVESRMSLDSHNSSSGRKSFASSAVSSPLLQLSPSSNNCEDQSLNQYQRLAHQIKEDLAGVTLEQQVDGFCKLAGLSSDRLMKLGNIGQELLQILLPNFNECTIFPVGPTFLGVATEFDTMCLVVDPFGKMAADRAVIFCDNESQEAVADEIYRLLKQQQYNLKFCIDVDINLSKISFNTKNRIKKITFVHKNSGTQCSVIVENYLAIQDTKIIKFLTSLDPRFHEILSLVNFWGHYYNVLHSEDEVFQNHALIWMLLSFMSYAKVIPTVNELYVLNKSPLILENVDIGYAEDVNLLSSAVPPMMDDLTIKTFSIISLLKKFFEFYAKADLKRFVVVPAVGQLVPVTAFGKVIRNSFPEEIKKRYLFGNNGSPRVDKFYIGSPMGLQHPLDLVSNLTRDVTFEEVRRFQSLCAATTIKLNKILETESNDIMSIFLNLEEESNLDVFGNLSLSSSNQDENISVESDGEPTTPLGIPPIEPHVVVESSWEMDTEDEENPLDDNRAYLTQLRRGKVRVNQSLRNYFEKAIAEIEDSDKINLMDVRKKFQTLWVQYVLEFNSVFWSKCFGFEVDCISLEQPDFSKTTDEIIDSLTIKERFDSIPTESDKSTLELTCSTNKKISDLLYKKKVWKPKFLHSHIRPLWALITENVTSKSTQEIDLTCVTKRVPLSTLRRMDFNCRLDITFDLREENDLPKNEFMATMVNITLNDTSYNENCRVLRNKKLRFLLSVYEILAMKYCNWRVKQWIGSCKDVEYKTFDESYKQEKRQTQRERNGHPRWRKFKRKWGLILKEREEIQERMEAAAELDKRHALLRDKRQQEREETQKKEESMRKKIKFTDDDDDD